MALTLDEVWNDISFHNVPTFKQEDPYYDSNSDDEDDNTHKSKRKLCCITEDIVQNALNAFSHTKSTTCSTADGIAEEQIASALKSAFHDALGKDFESQTYSTDISEFWDDFQKGDDEEIICIEKIEDVQTPESKNIVSSGDLVVNLNSFSLSEKQETPLTYPIVLLTLDTPITEKPKKRSIKKSNTKTKRRKNDTKETYQILDLIDSPRTTRRKMTRNSVKQDIFKVEQILKLKSQDVEDEEVDIGDLTDCVNN